MYGFDQLGFSFDIIGSHHVTLILNFQFRLK